MHSEGDAALVAIDVGGTSLRAVAVSRDGRLGRIERIPTPRESSGPTLAEALMGLVDTLRAPRDVVVCVGLPGIPATEGSDSVAVNLPGKGSAIASELEQAFGDRLRVFHDVRAALEAERVDGALAGVANGAVVSLGTGIGAGFVVDARILYGEGLVGEIGHLDVGSGIDCVCGARGCLETVASGPAVERAYRAAGGEALAASDVVLRALDGEPCALRAAEPALAGLVGALQALVAVVAPARIAFVGGVATAGPSFVGALARRLFLRLSFQRRPELVVGRYLGDASLLGVVRLGQQVVGIER